ncbi:hypothetical protein RR46_13533 [Papilio xuthus]|uniref:Uncharacterized protein n=1 Tax=Papilio xuthus TaxID=66420 RepID=A0A194PG86_PAPXU|nr:hypothetical protein RR46_13533 [Papilio xuthus]
MSRKLKSTHRLPTPRLRAASHARRHRVPQSPERCAALAPPRSARRSAAETTEQCRADAKTGHTFVRSTRY